LAAASKRSELQMNLMHDLRFRRMRTLRKFVAVHSSVHNHFNAERHLYSRNDFKLNRAAALT
jgi:putative transposase